jgi:hypothetical protein
MGEVSHCRYQEVGHSKGLLLPPSYRIRPQPTLACVNQPKAFVYHLIHVCRIVTTYKNVVPGGSQSLKVHLYGDLCVGHSCVALV